MLCYKTFRHFRMRIWCENEKKKYEIEHIYKTTYFVKSKFYYFDEDNFSVDKKGKFECKRLSKTMPAVTICMTHLFLRDKGNSSSAIFDPQNFYQFRQIRSNCATVSHRIESHFCSNYFISQKITIIVTTAVTMH